MLKRLTKPIRRSALWDCLAGVSAETVPLMPDAPAPLSDELDIGRALVLLVEDSPVNLEVGVAILESMGCTVKTAANGLSALDRHTNGEFDLIFMDCQMPEMDGYAASRELRRRQGGGRRIVIVAMTADAMAGAREACLAAGMDDHIVKPVKLE